MGAEQPHLTVSNSEAYLPRQLLSDRGAIGLAIGGIRALFAMFLLTLRRQPFPCRALPAAHVFAVLPAVPMVWTAVPPLFLIWTHSRALSIPIRR